MVVAIGFVGVYWAITLQVLADYEKGQLLMSRWPMELLRAIVANFKSTGILGKRAVNQIWTHNSTRSFSVSNTPFLRFELTFSQHRAAHTSVYDKNLDDELRPNVVPDDVIKPQSDKYWAPHPRTGVFGPATEQHLAENSTDSASVASGGQDPELDEKAWFRPTSLEDLEKPHHLN
ncbi:hypothetical protein SADUNF_Sadunf13G0071000 [Salix dunnii]|uniref:Uncharacterized protein n=1 Tax=Salix dunnii TaxID=1413687 RepID=A0A835JKV5_9ROSI|nr:hypothetical protein SADUNF_Sadunf13G0071000 [Salix dunnii]